jgi:hypothetical protein
MPPPVVISISGFHPSIAMENPAAVGNIFRRANPFQERGHQPYQ